MKREKLSDALKKAHIDLNKASKGEGYFQGDWESSKDVADSGMGSYSSGSSSGGGYDDYEDYDYDTDYDDDDDISFSFGATESEFEYIQVAAIINKSSWGRLIKNLHNADRAFSEQVQRAFERTAEVITKKTVPRMFAEGDAGGWAPLAEKTVKNRTNLIKRGLISVGPEHPILINTFDLYNEAINPSIDIDIHPNPQMVIGMDDTEVNEETRIKWIAHLYGTQTMPARKFFPLEEDDINSEEASEIERIWTEEIKDFTDRTLTSKPGFKPKSAGMKWKGK